MSKYINENLPVYFSYSWANDKFPDIEDDVKKLCAILEKNNIYYKRDKDNLSPWCVQIDETEKEIGRGAVVIVVISKRYIESLHCMHEWHRISEGGNIKERVLPIVLDDANILDKSVFMDYYNFFTKRREELVRQQLDGIIPLTKAETNAAEFDYYVADLKNMYQHLVNTNFGFRRDNEYSTVINRIKDLLGSSAASAPEPEAEDEPAPKKAASEPAPKKAASAPEPKKAASEPEQKKAASATKNTKAGGSNSGYNSLNANEQAVMQHFAIWGSCWIDLDALFDLLDEVVPDVEKALKQLAGKKMLETKTDKNGDVFYKIPAKILQELLDMDITDDADFSQYCDNVYSLVMGDDDEECDDEECDDEEEDDEDGEDDWFDIYAKPVLASVLDFGLMNDDGGFLYTLAIVLNYDNWCKPAKQLLLMAEPLYLKRKLDKGDLRSDLADVYYQLGNITFYQDEDNDVAEKYYRKAIKVAEAATTNDIASRRMEGVSYTAMADVLAEDDDRYDDAVSAYNKAIKILQGLRKYEGDYDIEDRLQEAKDSLKDLRG